MRGVEPPTYPLSRDAFRRALRTGHGRAVRHVRECGGADVQDVVVDAALRQPVLDPQIEGPRAGWIVDIVQRLELGAAVMDAIREAGPVSTDEFRDFDHRASVLGELARLDISGARELLYSMLAPWFWYDFVAARQVVALDGADGLVFVARRIGQWLVEDPDFVLDDVVLGLDERVGPERRRSVLEAAARGDADVRRYLAAVDGLRQASEDSAAGLDRFPERMRRIAPDVVIRRIREDPDDLRIFLPGWGLHADEDARRAVFAALRDESVPSRVARFLRVFSDTGPPYLDERLFAWAEDDDEEVALQAVKVLAHVAAAPVRELALRTLDIDRRALRPLRLLVKNFEPADHPRIERTLVPLDDEDQLHWWLADVVDLFEANPTTAATPSVLFAWEHQPCTSCRLDVIRLLDALGTTPRWVLEEARFDAGDEIRDAVRGRC